MRAPRWLATLSIPALIGAALVSSAAAAADPVDEGYLDQLRGMGFTWPPGHEASIVGMARIICDDLGWGWSPDRIANDVHAELDDRGVHYGQVAAMVNLAQSTYCPNQRCWAAHC